MKTIVAGIGAAVLVACGLLGQTAPPPPAFEVASIKPAAPQQPGRMMTSMGGDAGRVDYSNVNLKQVLMRAYDVKTYQISGPSWLDSERYDIVAKVPDGVPKEQIPAMLQALLAERFQMTIHRETKEQSVYALVVGKNGPKLKKSDDSAPMAFSGPGGGVPPAPPPPPPPGGGGVMGGMMMAPRPSGGGATSDAGRTATEDVTKSGTAAKPTGAVTAGGPVPKGATMISISSNGPARMQANGITMSGLTNMLSSMLDRPVVDMTEIQGNYDISLEMAAEEMVGIRVSMAGGGSIAHASPDGAAAAPAPESAPSASIFTAIQQLGLKLEPRKAPIEYIVVDKAEKVPTEN